MSKIKANFVVDDSFPFIDGVGHSDKIGFHNVKGGGSTNTTNFDFEDGDLHHHYTSRTPAVVGTQLSSTLFDPDLAYDQNNIWQLSNPNCLNGIYSGDKATCRGSDRVCLSRVEVSGTVYRNAGYHTYVGSPGGLGNFPDNRPKCFVALVLDTQCDGAIPPSGFFDFTADPSSAIWCQGNSMDVTAVYAFSGVPMLNLFPGRKRYRVLAYEVLDFDEKPDFSLTPRFTAGTETTAPWSMDVLEYRSHWTWPSCAKGFRFDVDLADVLCSFNSDAGGSINNIVDNALHVYAFCFDGISANNYTPGAFGTLYMSYFSRVQFMDWLSPTIPHAPAGADGPVVPPAEDDLEVLADESAKLAGLPALPDSPIVRERKKFRKGDAGFYNFMSRNDDVLMEFPDDPEVALLPTPGTRGSSKGPARKKGRRGGSYRGNLFPFGSFDPDEPGAGERYFKRGKF